jgi:hypothetical protein
VDRFWEKVERRGDDECWPWTGAFQNGGYGTFWLDGKQVPAHRVAYWLTHGEWAAGQVDHTCHNDDPTCYGLGPACPHRACQNPRHLRDATASQNQMGARNRCRKGHLWTTLGVDYQIISGFAHCYVCMRLNRKKPGSTRRENGSTTCGRGHDLTDPNNGYTDPKGYTKCRECARQRRRDARAS